MKKLLLFIVGITINVFFSFCQNDTTRTLPGDEIATNPFDVFIHTDKAKLALWNAENEVSSFLFRESLRPEQYEKALQYFNEAIENGFVDSYIYFEKGFCNYNLDRYENAVLDFSTALKLKKKTPDKLAKDFELDLGNMFYREDCYGIKDSIGGFSDLAVSIPVNFKVSDILLYRAASKRHLQDYRGAISDFNVAEPYNKNNDRLYFLRADCKVELQDYLNAKNDLTTAIKINNEECAYFGVRGACNYNLGFKESGCKDWSKAGELGCKDAYDQIKEYCNQ